MWLLQGSARQFENITRIVNKILETAENQKGGGEYIKMVLER